MDFERFDRMAKKAALIPVKPNVIEYVINDNDDLLVLVRSKAALERHALERGFKSLAEMLKRLNVKVKDLIGRPFWVHDDLEVVDIYENTEMVCVESEWDEDDA